MCVCVCVRACVCVSLDFITVSAFLSRLGPCLVIDEIPLFFSYAILHRLFILVFIPKLGPYCQR